MRMPYSAMEYCTSDYKSNSISVKCTCAAQDQGQHLTQTNFAMIMPHKVGFQANLAITIIPDTKLNDNRKTVVRNSCEK